MSATPTRLLARELAPFRLRPWTFYALAILVPWALWGVAAVLSRRTDPSPHVVWLTGALALIGLLAPALTAAVLIVPDRALRRDTAARLQPWRGLRPGPALLAVLLLPTSLLLATALSLLAGGSPEQFLPKGHSTLMIGTIGGWFAVAFAPFAEELAWHTYGTDALVSRWSVWRTSVVFAVFWALWHVPLAAIHGSYQAQVVDDGALQTLNFFASMVPFVVLMNWLYYRCARNVWVAVAFHLSANVGNELLRTSPSTKIVQTALLLVLTAAVLWHDRALFFDRPEVHDEPTPAHHEP